MTQNRRWGGRGGCMCYNWVQDNCADYVGTAAFNGTFNGTLRLSENKHSVPHELRAWLVYLIIGFASWSGSCLNKPKRCIWKKEYVMNIFILSSSAISKYYLADGERWDWNVCPIYVITRWRIGELRSKTANPSRHAAVYCSLIALHKKQKKSTKKYAFFPPKWGRGKWSILVSYWSYMQIDPRRDTQPNVSLPCLMSH